MSPPARQLILRPVSVDKTRPLLYTRSNISSAASSRHCVTRTSKSARFAEACGAAAAECTAVCCCCPMGIMEFLVLAIYKVPAGLCRRALRKKRQQRLLKKGMLQPRQQRIKPLWSWKRRCGILSTVLGFGEVPPRESRRR